MFAISWPSCRDLLSPKIPLSGLLPPCLLLASAMVLAAPPAGATSYVLVPDTDLVGQADLIVEGRTRTAQYGLDTSSGGASPTTDYTIDIESPLAGFAAGSSIVVRVPGGTAPDGSRLQFFGAPEFRAGERVLLLLSAHADGTYGVLHFHQGAFHIVHHQGRDLLVRDLYESTEFDASGEAVPPSRVVRDLDAFRRWLHAPSADTTGSYLVLDAQAENLQTENPQTLRPRFNLLNQEESARWPHFDRGQTVDVFAYQDGQPGYAGGGFDDIRRALAVWTNDPATPIRFRYAGTTTANGGFTQVDHITSVHFDNPNNYFGFGKPFDCDKGGVLALGGYNTENAVHGHRGRVFRNIYTGNVVTNKNITCWAQRLPLNFEQLMGHEFGHVLGFGHTCQGSGGSKCETDYQTQAMMRGFTHKDGRGAVLADADRAAACYLYGSGNSCPYLTEPSDLQAEKLPDQQVRLTWRDNSNNETAFQIEYWTSTANQFLIAGQAAANATEYVYSRAPNTNGYHVFRVRAINASANSLPSEDASISLASGGGGGGGGGNNSGAPTGLTATVLSPGSGRLSWTAPAAEAPTGYLVQYRVTGAPLFADLTTVGADVTEVAVSSGLEPGTSYTFQVFALYGGRRSNASNPAFLALPNARVPVLPDQVLALPASATRLLVTWLAADDDIENGIDFGATHFQVNLSADGAPYTTAGIVPASQNSLEIDDLEPGVDYRFRVRALSWGLPSDFTYVTRATLPTLDGPCQRSARTACLLDDRFEVKVAWRNPRNSTTGDGRTEPVSDQSASFWFFNEDNTEVIVKMIDGRGNNGHFWFFSGALSDLEHWVTVRDTETGELRTYANAFGDICGVADNRALGGGETWQTPPVMSETLASFARSESPKDGTTCGGDANSLCLLDGRVRVDVTFEAPNGQAGVATPLVTPQSSDRTGLLWFFRQSNPELVVKAIDGTGNNGHIWIFWGALTNVAYEITVTDTVTGSSKSYVNEQGNVCGGADVRAL